MSLTVQEIDEVFADFLGLPPPEPAEITALTSVPNDYTALDDIAALPQVQAQVVPVLQMFDLATGHNPNPTTLSSIVSSDLTQPQLANALVVSSAFADLYNSGVTVDPNAPVTTSLVDAMFLNGLGHAPTAATEHGFAGLTNAQAFLAIASSDAMTETHAVGIHDYIANGLTFVSGVPI